MKRYFALLLIFAILMPPVLHAEDVWTMAESDQYGKKAGGMFGRGLINLATCWVDVIVSTVEGTKTGPAFIGTVGGLGRGIGCTALRALSGGLDVVSFWVPSFNGFPVCKSYADCISCAPKAEIVPAMAPAAPQAEVVEAPAPVIAESPMRYVKK